MSNYNKPRIWNIEPFIELGINPDTGLPYKLDNVGGEGIKKQDVKRALSKIDRLTALSRFTWYNLPEGLDSDIIERILYYRGQGMFFKMNDNFYFLPFALDGGIDMYGRYLGITPLPFGGSTQTKDEKPLVKGLTYKPLYDVQIPEDFITENGINEAAIKEVIDNGAVIIRDHSHGISQFVEPPVKTVDCVLDFMSECLPLMRTALFNSTGVQGLRVGTQDEQQNAEIANRSINSAALDGKRFVPVIGTLDFQELAGNNPINAEEFLLSMQGLDNFRLSLYGISNGGLFEKRSGVLPEEAALNQGNIGLILQDGLRMRQDACDIINSAWGLNMWCEVSETISNVDMNGDGLLGSNEDETYEETGGNEE